MATRTLSMKLWDGWRVYDGKETRDYVSPVDVWDAFGWDIENNKNHREWSTEITRQMYCFGHIDLTEAVGRTLVLDVIPTTNDEWEEIEE